MHIAEQHLSPESVPVTPGVAAELEERHGSADRQAREPGRRREGSGDAA